MDFDSKRAWARMPQVNGVNKNRSRLAQQRGWQFAEQAPELLDRWPVLPFTQRGDMRLVYGALSGICDGLSFTMSDFMRRQMVINKQVYGMTFNQHDKMVTDSVWVVRLPAPMPFFQITSRDQVYFDIDDSPHPTTGDRKFDKRHQLVDTDPHVAAQVLTPGVMATVREARLGTWTLLGTELVYAENCYLGGTGPNKVVETLGKLAMLVSQLPFHLGGGQPAPQAYPQPGYPQPQPTYPPQQYQRPAYPPQHHPGYPTQQPPAHYPPAQYPQPGYPQPFQQIGYPPPPGHGYPAGPPPSR
ncbi:hypothetical protein SAMN05192558_101663 [Actinokineospora alba]|uniref:Uncharacterized protein n=1 Tax=Actinokineospora alba TaxID=504798 RepID=A0A1H0G503_9PSEU|nr:hypothetical protein [Actinokineospora alba]TDP69764.1 hypothetical protein C8E96_5358 [Actinokineospora alba]SDI09251.1 hypothetical protein SAMN05421871_103208 [Actinokineospora alba]SDO01942.1 hypothetical protein SAMN05192558_101663 [Actinokineospora alba]